MELLPGGLSFARSLFSYLVWFSNKYTVLGMGMYAWGSILLIGGIAIDIGYRILDERNK